MWPGLLAWSTQYHDGTAPSNFKKMSKEDKDFLQGALDDAMALIEDPNKVLQEGLDLLEAENDKSSPEKITTALEVIDRCVDDPDCARNLEKFGGIKALLKYVNSEYDEISSKSCEILSLMLANNEELQLAAYEKCGALDVLTTGDKYTKPRLGLLASIVRGHPVITAAFLSDKYDGLCWLCGVFVATNRDQVQERAVTFIRHLILEDPKRAKTNAALLQKNVVIILTNIANEPEKSSLQYTEIVAEIASIVIGVSGKTADVDKIRQQMQARIEWCAKQAEKEDYEEESKTLRQALNRHTLEHAFDGQEQKPKAPLALK